MVCNLDLKNTSRYHDAYHVHHFMHVLHECLAWHQNPSTHMYIQRCIFYKAMSEDYISNHYLFGPMPHSNSQYVNSNISVRLSNAITN